MHIFACLVIAVVVQLWLCSVVALGLALGTQAAEARECARETPLPAEVHLIAPGSVRGGLRHVILGPVHNAYFMTVTAAHDGWERVTFGDALNMATGIGENWPQRVPNHPFADSNRSPKFFRWSKAKTAQEKLDIGFSFGKYPLTTLLQHGGQHHGQPLLSAAKLAEALHRTDAKGLPSGWTANRFGEGEGDAACQGKREVD